MSIHLSADTVAEEATVLVGLRALRVWHWREAMRLRKKANRQADKGVADETTIHANNEKADYHIKQVQLLNEFFGIGDTAEADDK